MYRRSFYCPSLQEYKYYRYLLKLSHYFAALKLFIVAFQQRMHKNCGYLRQVNQEILWKKTYIFQIGYHGNAGIGIILSYLVQET